MTNDKLTKPTDEIAALVARVAHYSESTVTDATRRSYGVEFKYFRQWAEQRNLPALPTNEAVVSCYLVALAEGQVTINWTDRQGNPRVSKKAYKVASIKHVYQAIIFHHRQAGHEWAHANPVITKVLKGLSVRKGTRGRKVQPLTIDDLKLVLSKMRERRFEELKIIRDRAMFTLCFFGAFRRGELVRLRVEDLTFTDQGLVVLLPKSKTDQEGQGQEVAILPQKDPLICPIRLMREWLEKGELKSGYLFCRIDRNGYMGKKHMTGEGFALLVKDYVEQAGLDPEVFSGHSLRAGFATSAAAAGKSLHNIMRQTRHKDERVAMSYIRHGSLFDSNATDGLGDGEDE